MGEPAHLAGDRFRLSARRSRRDCFGDDAIALERAQRALFAGSWLVQGYSSAAFLEQRRGCPLFWCPHPDRGPEPARGAAVGIEMRWPCDTDPRSRHINPRRT